MDETRGFVLFGTGDPEGTQSLRESLRKRGAEALASASLDQMLEIARRRRPEVAVFDDGLDLQEPELLIRLLKSITPDTRIIHLLPAGSHPDRNGEQPLVCSLAWPVSDGELEAVIWAALADRRPAAQGAASPLIFCVDDDVPFLRSLVRLLRRRGYAVMGYEHPEQALEGAPVYKPSLAILDVLMPGMNGLDLASELREGYGAAFPIVFLSAKNSDREISEGYRSGARCYITKPCEPNRIVSVAHELLRKPGSEQCEMEESRL